MPSRPLALIALLCGLNCQAADLTTTELSPSPLPALEGSAHASAASSPAAAAAVSVADLGFLGGWTFEGLGAHQRSFHFPIPQHTPIREARFRLGYTAAAGLMPHSILRVEVNGQPLHSRQLHHEGSQWIELSIPQEAFRGEKRDFISLTLHASLLMTDDRCIDERVRAGFLHLDPSSSLQLTLGATDDTISGAWERLPRHTTVSLSADADELSFVNALQVTHQLIREGKQVEITHLPQLGDILIAPAAELETALGKQAGGAEAWASADANANLRLLNLPGRQIITLAPEDRHAPAALTGSGWLPLAHAPATTVRRAESLHSQPPASAEEIALSRLSKDWEIREVARGAEWHVPLGANRTPVGLIPDRLRLIVTSPALFDPTPMMLYAYVGNTLQDARALKGGTEEITLHFKQHSMRGIIDDLRLEVRRDPSTAPCSTMITTHPVQISPDSSIVFARDGRGVQDFGDLPRAFSGGANLIIAPELVHQAESTLPFIARLLLANQYPLQADLVTIANAPADVSRPFMLFSGHAQDVKQQTVHFDRGQITVQDSEGGTILDMSAPEKTAVAQLVEQSGHPGLWVRPFASGALPSAPASALELTFDKAAFINDHGIALSLPAERADFARVEYPVYRGWLDFLSAYRYWFMAIGWLLMAALLAHLYVQVRSHKKTR